MNYAGNEFPMETGGSPRVRWFADFIEQNGFISALIRSLENRWTAGWSAPASTDSMCGFVSHRSGLITEQAAVVCERTCDTAQRLYSLLPDLDFSELADLVRDVFAMFTCNARLKGFIFETLTKLGVLRLRRDASNDMQCRCVVQCPVEASRRFRSARSSVYDKCELTGSLLSRVANARGDRCPEIMKLLSRPRLRISSYVWDSVGTLPLATGADPDKIRRHRERTARIIPMFAELAGQDYFRASLKQDWRGRVYVREGAANYTSCRQIRNLIESADPAEIRFVRPSGSGGAVSRIHASLPVLG